MQKTVKFIVFAVFLLLPAALSLSAATAAVTGNGQPDTPVLENDIRFTADEMQYDRELDIITARGNVKVINEPRILYADVIVYNRRQDLLSASGNVTLVEPTGEVLFAEFMDLKGDIKNGVIQDLRAVLSDKSLIASSGGRRTDGNRLDLRQVVYSPCRLCAEDPTRPPLWQIKAVKVVHDKNRQTIEYSDAWLEVAGIPVLYTPYLSHPDPTVKRRSGFLAPSFGSSSTLGATIATPYFLDIAPNSDATLIPVFTGKQGLVMAAEYRHKFIEGEFTARGSITQNTPEDEQTYTTEDGIGGFRGHLATKGRFDFDETWRWGFDVNRATDGTYMSKFKFNEDNTLPETRNSLASRGFVEGFRKRNYVYASATDFQSLQDGATDQTTPVILPYIEYAHESEPDRFGGQTKMDLNFVALSRSDGNDTRRFSAKSGWQLPYTSAMGDTYTLSASLRGDLYHVNGLTRDNGEKYSGVSYRVLPQIALDWRFPFVREEGRNGSVYQLFEPIASAIVSPYGGNPETIPDEDSLNFEFDDTNLFSTNRFSGLDRVEGGPRINYGFKWGVFGRKGGNTTLLVGQSYRYKVDDTFSSGSGLENNFSDIVGRLHASPGAFLDLNYRTRIGKDRLDFKRNELSVSVGGPALKLDTSYTFIDPQEGGEFAGREELSNVLSSQFSRYWRGSIRSTQDVAAEEIRSLNLALTYEDECFLLSSGLSRTFFEDRDLRPEDSVVFRILFKTLGEISPSVSLFNN